MINVFAAIFQCFLAFFTFLIDGILFLLVKRLFSTKVNADHKKVTATIFYGTNLFALKIRCGYKR